MSTEDMPGDMTDGFHLVVEALKLNAVDTIYAIAACRNNPSQDMGITRAPHRRREFFEMMMSRL